MQSKVARSVGRESDDDDRTGRISDLKKMGKMRGKLGRTPGVILEQQRCRRGLGCKKMGRGEGEKGGTLRQRPRTMYFEGGRTGGWKRTTLLQSLQIKSTPNLIYRHSPPPAISGRILCPFPAPWSIFLRATSAVIVTQVTPPTFLHPLSRRLRRTTLRTVCFAVVAR